LNKYSWAIKYIKIYNKMFLKAFDDSNELFYTYIDTFFKEFFENEKFLKSKGKQNNYNTKQFLLLVDPFFQIICTTDNFYIIKIINQKIFSIISNMKDIDKNMLLKKINKYMLKCRNKHSSKVLNKYYLLLFNKNKNKNNINDSDNKITIQTIAPIFMENYNQPCNNDNTTNNDNKNDKKISIENRSMGEVLTGLKYKIENVTKIESKDDNNKSIFDISTSDLNKNVAGSSICSNMCEKKNKIVKKKKKVKDGKNTKGKSDCAIFINKNMNKKCKKT
ncbi:nucleolar protein Nop52, putative, partial [Hepatocystis sp. ex Piliocolobus tephrosceles]